MPQLQTKPTTHALNASLEGCRSTVRTCPLGPCVVGLVRAHHSQCLVCGFSIRTDRCHVVIWLTLQGSSGSSAEWEVDFSVCTYDGEQQHVRRVLHGAMMCGLVACAVLMVHKPCVPLRTGMNNARK